VMNIAAQFIACPLFSAPGIDAANQGGVVVARP
jgi:hypothetical protein